MGQYSSKGDQELKLVTLGGVNKNTGAANPTTVKGYYKGKRELTFSTGEPSTFLILQTKDGDVGVRETKNMTRGLSDIEEQASSNGDSVIGAHLTITYVGSDRSKNGFTFKKFNVDADTSNRLASSTAFESGDDYEAGSSADDVETEQVAAANVAAAAATRQEKVRQLLSKK